MKKLITCFTVILAAAGFNLFAQTSAKITIHKTDNTSITINLSDIDSISFTPCEPVGFRCGDTISDIEGRFYNTVRIGTQCWMKENLNSHKFLNGDSIPEVKPDEDWAILFSAAFCFYNNENISNPYSNGSLYNWYAVNDSRGLCPAGWHLPSNEEWTVLTEYLGGQQIAGGKMKEASYGLWINPNTDATNESGFTAIPAGYRREDGSFADLSYKAIFWSSSESDNVSAWQRALSYNSGAVSGVSSIKRSGFSVRCVMDE
jgi:uncharacterized protein (TIGR02145 family)